MCTDFDSDIRPPFSPYFSHVPVPPQNTNQNVLSKHINSPPYVSRVGLSKNLNNGYHIVKNTEIKNKSQFKPQWPPPGLKINISTTLPSQYI